MIHFKIICFPEFDSNVFRSISISDYPTQPRNITRTVTTTDLLCWSFQIARGMQFLTSRNVLHGNLTAQNILLCDNNVVKITDFGLDRAVHKSNVYLDKRQVKCQFFFFFLEMKCICKCFFFSLLRIQCYPNGLLRNVWPTKNSRHHRMSGHLELYFGSYFHLAPHHIREKMITFHCKVKFKMDSDWTNHYSPLKPCKSFFHVCNLQLCQSK